MPDLGAGFTSPTNAMTAVFGQSTNVSGSDIPAFTNATYLGLAGLADTGAALVSGQLTSVAVPVDWGVVITKLTVWVGGTAASTPTHSFGALYSGIGTPALLAQSTDGTTAAIAASAAFTFNIPATQVNATNAPKGFIYASVSVTGTAVPSLATVSVATAVGYKWFTNGPLGVCLQHGSAVAGTAPGTITGQSAQAATPVYVLT